MIEDMRNSRICLSALTAFAIIFAGCENRTYHEYYNNEGGAEIPTQSCWEYLSSQSDLSTFCSMLKQTGYDKVLSQNTSFTVWAPVNSALTDIDLNDLQQVMELVLTHISLFAYSTSNERDPKEKVTLLSGKVASFVGMDFGGIALKQANINVKNGLVHTLSGHAVYKPNILEMTMRLAESDSIASYIASLTKKEFSPLLSTEIGTNAYGQPIYDSVFVEANYFLDEVADIDYEDTVFTVLFPDNEVWTEYYDMVRKYHVTRSAEGGAAAQRENSCNTMVRDLVFSGYVDLDNLPDSLVTTTGSILYNVEDLFRDVVLYECSNGYMYLNRSMSYHPAETWLKPIMIEAESPLWGRSAEKTNIYSRSSIGKRFAASNNTYIEAEVTSDATSLDKIYVEFPIPNILSATYNIYCVFIPESITEATERPCKVSFELSYRDAGDNLVVAKSILGATQTDGTKTDTIAVGQHTFSFCNLYDEDASAKSDISTRLRISNKQRRASTRLTNVLRPDVIIFEPVIDTNDMK